MAINLLLVVISAMILWKTAAWFVEGAVGIAVLLDVPKMIIGLVLVSVATTSPELFTSVIAALHGYPEMALGNAVGSVIVDASLALGIAAVVSTFPLTVDPAIFRISARTVLAVLILAFIFVLNGTLGRIEGLALLACYGTYTLLLYRHFKIRRRIDDPEALFIEEGVPGGETAIKWSRVVLLFGLGLAGVLIGSELLVQGAVGLAVGLGLSPVVIGLTVTALGTSMPEIATCVAAALKRESAIGVGNIIGADILNICWVAGLSSVVNPLTAEKHVLLFMFPAALLIVSTMVIFLYRGYRLQKWNGAVLVMLYIIYAATLFTLISPVSVGR